MTELRIDVTDLAGAVVATPSGRLDLAGYPVLRDGLLKLAAGSPLALIVRLGPELDIASRAMHAVFTTVWMRISQWPDIPMVLVAETDRHRHELGRGGVTRFVATAPDLTAALQIAKKPPERRFHRVALPNSPTAPMIARGAARDACEQWRLPALRDDAMLVVSELVENAVRHAHSASVLRIELRARALSIAVRDDDPAPAVLAAASPDVGWYRGLELVNRISVHWGSTPSSDGGKIVWAVLARRGGE